VAAAPDATVRLSFAARPGVCGDGHSVIAFECADGKCGRGRWGRTITLDRGFDDDDVEYDCEPGPVRIALRVRTGRVQSLRTYVGGRWVVPPRDAAVTDLGTASAQQPHDAGVPALIRLARTHPEPGVRRKALFWLGQSGDPRALALFEELLTKP